MAVRMDEQRRRKYEEMLEEARMEILEIDEVIENELALVKERITDLNRHKEAIRQIYDASCVRLGIASDLDEFEEEEV